MKNNYLNIAFLITSLLFIATANVYSQNNQAAMANADTVNFSVNRSGGWELFNSYATASGTDSVRLEFIVQHLNNINWGQEQYVGRVKTGAYKPGATRTVTYNLLSSVFTIKILSNGKCYLKLESPANLEQVVVIPVHIVYRR